MNFHIPLSKWARDRRLFLIVAMVHVYLGGGHILGLFGEHVDGLALWTDIWKGFGAWIGAYYFLALAGRAPSPPN